MKKIVAALLSTLGIFLVLSCTTTSTMDDGAQARKQAELNKSFDKVYSNHEQSLVLEGAETYTVKKNDTLTSITKTFYAGNDTNGYYFPLIMLASHNVVNDPELITPGMKLTIPNFEKNIKDEAVAKKLSSYFRDLSEVYRQKDTPAAADILPHLLEIADELAKNQGTSETGTSESKNESRSKASTEEPFVIPN
ncbi:MAG: LysM peptidoglycan-binding domain-containing protein [Treponema sp.]|nr:LysM peptidoglycan-binding domain-containing protein [Treponema sp.]